jgi:23S rRNA (adenine2503-C2)-methyltransferase
VHAGRLLIELRKIQNLMHRFFGLDHGGMRRVHVVRLGRNQFAIAVRRVAIFHSEILDAQAADRRHHPTILIAMIVDPADLADIPADGQNFKKLAFVNEIPGVVAFRVVHVGLQRFRLDRVARSEFKDRWNGELFLGDGAEFLDPFVDTHYLHRRFIFNGRNGCHVAPLTRNRLITSHYIPTENGGHSKICVPAACYHQKNMSLRAANKPFDLLGKSPGELREFVQSLGEPAYRGGQIYHALYAERRFDVAAMTNLPARLRQRLARESTIDVPQVRRRYESSDGAVRYVLALDASDRGGAPAGKPATVEAVFMPEENRQTICISTQAGCAVDCHFCLTATLGLIRNLTAGEMVGQVLMALEDQRANLKPQTNVVLMGQGEPLLNYDAVTAALRILLDPNGMAITPKHTTLSTSGIIPGIEKLALEKVRPKLAISLNASSNEQRDAIMPINRKYPIEKLLEACARYPLRSWEHLTFEYVLLGGFNDAPEDAMRLAKLIANLRSKVNLIPWNPGDLPYEKPNSARIEEFRRILDSKGIPAFVRYSRGQDVMAACGQLAVLESARDTSGLGLSQISGV